MKCFAFVAVKGNIAMSDVLTELTSENVRTVCKDFEADYKDLESALSELFAQYPKNAVRAHVLLKVVALNTLYSTQIPLYGNRIPTIWDVVDHILGLRIDDQLGSEDLVDKIAKIDAKEGRKGYYYSFATKYCSWSQTDSYPIWDSRVDLYLWTLRNNEKGKQGGLRQFKRKELWSYPEFKKVVTDFRAHFRLEEFSFKQIDEFLWTEGGKLFGPGNKQEVILESVS